MVPQGKEKEDIKVSGIDELLFLTKLICICAIAVWELVAWASKHYVRYCKSAKKAQQLKRVSQLAARAAREEVDAASSSTSRRVSSGVMTEALGEDVPFDQPVLAPPERRQGETARRGYPEAVNTMQQVELPEERPHLSPPPTSTVRRRSVGGTETEENTELERVCHDVWMLMTTEALKDAPRSQELMTSAVQQDQAR